MNDSSKDPVILNLEGVTKRYAGFKALDNITLSVGPGAIGLLGPNGAGKSTLIKSLLGLVRLTEGRAQLLGLDVQKDSRRVRQITGYMPEDDCYLPGMSGVRSVAYAGELAGLPPQTALRRAHEVLDYVTLAEERYREVQTYSTGMKQKVKLAQAIIHDPKLVFLDEPTSGMDPAGREKMLQLIRHLAKKQGVSVVVSTHILRDIEISCESVVILGRGRLLVHDTLQNLRKEVDNRYRVRVGGDSAAFITAAKGFGIDVTTLEDGDLQAAGDGPATVDRLFEAAKQSGATVRQVEASRTSLEEIFMKAVTGGANADL